MASATEPADLAYELIDGLPDSIRIGAHDYEINKWDLPKHMSIDYFAQCDVNEQRISIVKQCPSRSKAVEAFMHEVAHAVYEHSHLAAGDDEERIVTAFSHGMTDVFRDNAWFMLWVCEGLHLKEAA